MAGIKGTRVESASQGPGGKNTRSGGSFIKQDSSIVQPTRAQRPVAKKMNEFTSDKSDAMLKTRPSGGSK